ncbi:hypothetical protein H6CHR_00173 [Variovorax sp. PBL-H6]|uniref:hypothetical protein n=1 Tax=Variovorax sp. PBL-H6 TaxID=434009 RepID=UPI00131663CA|nr:hypothetical protein [Variovorax sp. PBL-H6]VTU15266.1 hypothetical protein H6CHR_00173 [Variovorax sp. PBL-H6]
MPSLRHIAVYVEEPKAGRFAWVLAELEGRSWRQLDKSDSPVASYKTAMAEGLLALQAMVDDLDAGPRESDAPARPGDAGESRDQEAERAAPAKEAAPGKRYFGFGPAQ